MRALFHFVCVFATLLCCAAPSPANADAPLVVFAAATPIIATFFLSQPGRNWLGTIDIGLDTVGIWFRQHFHR